MLEKIGGKRFDISSNVLPQTSLSVFTPSPPLTLTKVNLCSAWYDTPNQTIADGEGYMRVNSGIFSLAS